MIQDKRNDIMCQMIRILEYLECPQYLRKNLFPKQEYLRFAGLLNPLAAPHHFSINDNVPYREGVVLNNPNRQGSFVYIGLKQNCQIDRCLKPNVRVTVKIDQSTINSRIIKGKVVSPSEPREKCGLYFGYSIRFSNSLKDVLNNCPFNGGYDLKIGTSDKGENVDKTLKRIPKNFTHALIVFGGVSGIESAHESDTSLENVQNTAELFDFYLNTCPGQGSNTIRTEEAILISLAALRKRLFRRLSLN